MQVTRMNLADTGSPEGLVRLILKLEPELNPPVPIEELCYQLDIQEISPLETEGFVGGLLTDTSRSSGIILVKKGLSEQRKRFTLGHELGHFLIATHMPDKDGQFLCSSKDMSLLATKEQARRAQMEIEANRFSSLILIPPPKLRPLLNAHAKPSIEQMFELAEHFGVSKEAMSRAYADYHPEAVAFVIVENGIVRRVYKNQRNFPFVVVRKGDAVPTGSLYHHQRHKRGIPSALESVIPDYWIDVERGKKAPLLSEQVCLAANGYAFLMLWHEAQDDEDEFDEDENRTAKERLKYRQSRYLA